MHDVFISYSTADRAVAERLAGVLAQGGLSVWWDREIPFGESFDRVIERELTRSRAVIVLWSRASTESDWVRNEARRGLGRGVLIPARIDAVEVPLEFSNVQTADLSAWQPGQPHAAFDKLVARLRQLIGQPAAAGHVAAPPATAPALPPQSSLPTKRRTWLGAAVAAIAVAAGGAYLWFSAPTGIEVPDVVSTPVIDAKRVLAEHGFVWEQGRSWEVEQVPPGTVLAQSQPAGLRVPRGTKVVTDVSVAAQRSVPSLVGLSGEEAAGRLAQAGLRVGRTSPDAAADARPGTIVRQSPPSDTRLPRDSAVDIVVAAAPALIEVPDVRGLFVKDAAARMAGLKLAVNPFRSAASATVKAESVVDQDPPPGRRVPAGTAVTLTYAKAQPASSAIEAGPLWSQADAERKCPAICSKAARKWTGQWWTTVPSKMSVCQCGS